MELLRSIQFETEAVSYVVAGEDFRSGTCLYDSGVVGAPPVSEQRETPRREPVSDDGRTLFYCHRTVPAARYSHSRESFPRPTVSLCLWCVRLYEHQLGDGTDGHGNHPPNRRLDRVRPSSTDLPTWMFSVAHSPNSPKPSSQRCTQPMELEARRFTCSRA